MPADPPPLDAPAIFAILDAHQVEYVLIGGYAAGLHGSTRVTTDVDVTPDRTHRNLGRLATALRELGGGIRVDDLEEGLPFDTSAETLATTKTLNLRTPHGDIDLTFEPLGQHLEVVGDLEPLVSEDPTVESLAGLLMLALYRGGRQGDALEVYTRTRNVLDETLGLEPSVSLRSLHERVLRQDESLGVGSDMGAGSAVAAVRSRSAEDRRALTNLPTIVRNRERRRLLVRRLEQVEEDYDTDLIDARRYKTKEEKVTAELVEIEARINEGVQAATVSPIFGEADPGQAFLDAPVDVQRVVLRAVLRVEVGPAMYRGSAWSSERLRLSPVVPTP